MSTTKAEIIYSPSQRDARVSYQSFVLQVITAPGQHSGIYLTQPCLKFLYVSYECKDLDTAIATVTQKLESGDAGLYKAIKRAIHVVYAEEATWAPK